MKRVTFLSIYSSQKKQQTAKPRGSKSNTAQYSGLSKQQCIKLLRATPEIFCSLLCEFYHSTNPFSPCFLLLFFCLVAFFILHAIRLNLFFSAFHYWACLPSLHVSLFKFLNLLCIHYHSFIDIKMLQQDLIHYKGVAMW